jgi:hypothetical protein
MKQILFCFFAIASLIISCNNSEPDPATPPSTPQDCSTVSAGFSQANSIFQNSCANASSCHGSGSTSGPGPLLTYNQIFNARTSIRSAVQNGRMPQGGSLSASQKATIVAG